MFRPQAPPSAGDEPCRCELASSLGLTAFLHPRRYRAGDVLWAEGQLDGRLVIVDQGRVKAVKAQPDGGSVLLYVFSRGSVFGFLPFFDGGAYPATAIAVEDAQTREISRAGLHAAIQEEPSVALALLSVLSKRLREAMRRVEDLSHQDATARVAAALLLLVPLGAPRSLLLLDIPRPQYAFAADVGVTPETFSRALTRLGEAGALRRLSGAKLQVLSLAELERAAAGDAAL